MGQDILGAVSQIAAEELGLRYQDVHVVSGNTDITMFDAGQHVNRSLYSIANAVKKSFGGG